MRSLSLGCACHGTVASHLLAELPKPALNPVLHCLAGLGRPPLDLLGELVEGRVGRGRGVQLPERLVVDPKILSEHEVVVLVRHGGGSAGEKPRPLGAAVTVPSPFPPLSSKNESFEFSQLDSRSKDFHGKSQPSPGRSASPTKSFFLSRSFCACATRNSYCGPPPFRVSSVSPSRKGSFEFEAIISNDTRLIRADADKKKKRLCFQGKEPANRL